MAEAPAFTAAEVAFVLQEPVKTVRKALDEGPVRAKLVRKPGGAVRTVGWKDLLYLFAVRSLRDELTPKARNEFYRAFKHAPVERAREVRFGHISVLLDDIKEELKKRARELAELADKVEFRKDGEAVLKGSDIEVYRIAALLSGGMSPEEICEDYPSLTPEMLTIARSYAEAYPKTGRPYPAKTVKRALKGAGLEVLDDVLDGNE